MSFDLEDVVMFLSVNNHTLKRISVKRNVYGLDVLMSRQYITSIQRRPAFNGVDGIFLRRIEKQRKSQRCKPLKVHRKYFFEFRSAISMNCPHE